MIPNLLRRKSMRRSARWWAAVVACLVMMLAIPAIAAMDQAMPTHDVPVDKARMPAGHETMLPPAETESEAHRDAFAGGLDLSEFRLLAVQHNGQVKILDSWARQSLDVIAHHRTLDGQDPVYTAFDMILRKDVWAQKNIIYIQAVPIRQLLSDLADNAKERERIMKEGTVSPAFISQEKVFDLMQRTEANDQRLSDSIDKVYESFSAFTSLDQSLAIAPPALPDRPWIRPLPELIPNSAKHRLWAMDNHPESFSADAPAVPGYSDEMATGLLDELDGMVAAWRIGDVVAANTKIAALSSMLPQIQPRNYPAPFKREVELWYNKSYNGTIIGVFLYGTAMVLFLLFVSGVANGCYKWGLGFYLVAVSLNVVVMAVRWYIAGRIPIQNQFESVMGSAFFGCLLGARLELWKRNGLFGMAMSFVGFLFTTACMVVPLVFGKSIGENVAPAAGILMTYWLWIHVNVVIFSYALIAASFVIGSVFLIARLWHWISPTVELAGAAGGPGSVEVERIEHNRRNLLDSLDAADVIIMRLAFFFLGLGIILGAVWADVSWGRPWGWDPKETFALVTWLVYLILVHVRFAAPSTKGAATAALSVAGFAVMLFNWIGVNFFLVGLHSYA
jgi:cytochrome c-type biogenesis protein CcsB